MAIEKTYNMIKPDGVRNGHIGEIITRIERVGLTIERMELGMVTIRGDFGLTVDENVIHGSDSVASAEREIKVFFGE